jgi:hypothetical protein
MLVAFLSLALAAQAPVPDAIPRPATPQVVIARVAACGVKRRDARIRVDHMLQEAVVDVRPVAAPSDAQLACLARVSAEAFWFLVFDDATQARFEPLYSRASEDANLTSARAWVAAHGLAGRLPPYRKGRDDPALVIAAIEKLCRAPARSFRNNAGMMTAESMESVSGEQFICALNVATVAGLPFGFIGNEAEAPPPH